LAPGAPGSETVDRKPEAREAALDDDEVSLRYDYSRLILEGGRDALDQAEKTVAARLNVRTCAEYSWATRSAPLLYSLSC
jgi:hypothetical protein